MTSATQTDKTLWSAAYLPLTLGLLLLVGMVALERLSRSSTKV